MARLTITEAARVTGVSRVTLHRYIKAGKLSRSADGTIDTAELLRIGLVLQPDTVLQPVSMQRNVTPPETSPVTSPDPATLQHLITVLQRELDAAHAREEAAREREALLLQMLQQMQQQHQRVLDMPRRTPPPVPRPEPHSTQAPGDPRGEMRRRIVALLREHPEGLSPAQTRHLLGVEKELRSTMKHMARDGLLRRGETGRYVVPEP
jgi:hypothetical protein